MSSGAATVSTGRHISTFVRPPAGVYRRHGTILSGISHTGSLQAQRTIQTRCQHHIQVLRSMSIAGLSNRRCVCSRRPPFLSVFIVFASPAFGVTRLLHGDVVTHDYGVEYGYASNHNQADQPAERRRKRARAQGVLRRRACRAGRGPDFLRLANALSALYPHSCEEKLLLDAMLLAAPL